MRGKQIVEKSCGRLLDILAVLTIFVVYGKR